MRCICLIRSQPDYRREAFVQGLRSVGYQVLDRAPLGIRPSDVLLIWNRYGDGHRLACQFEAAGARVIVAENGYLGREWNNGIWYAMALGWHNGGGRWPRDAGRAVEHDVPLRDWRTYGKRIVVLAQRGIGVAPIAQPMAWAENAVDAIRRRTKRPVVLRKHPGEQGRNQSLDDALQDAWACVTWGSGAGLKAITLGVPVFHGLKCWIGAPAAREWTQDIEDPFRGDRRPMLRSLMNAQWRLDEIQRGECFRALLA